MTSDRRLHGHAARFSHPAAHLRLVATPRPALRGGGAHYALGLAVGFALVALVSAASGGAVAVYLGLAAVAGVVAVAGRRGGDAGSAGTRRAPRPSGLPGARDMRPELRRAA